MALDDYFEPEVAVAVAATAVLLSPRGREFLRAGLVRGIAGALTVADTIAGFGRGVRRGLQSPDTTADGMTTSTAGQHDRTPVPADA